VRVKISYGVDIEDVPSEIEQLFDFVYEKKLKFENQLELAEKLLEEAELESAIEIMDKLRLTLAEMDNRIIDVSSIAQGYVQYKEQEQEQEAGANDVSERGPFVDTTGIDTTESKPE
jgi:hypothetical protein